ncbi:MAG: (Fe-S)-binding protein [Campylobacteraceae bacterium]
MYDFNKVSDACVKCGKCIPDCTIHQINPDEVTSPRGFLDLVGAYQRGELELDKNAKDIFEKCFLCTTCVSVCPNKLEVDFAIENVRRDIAKKFGIAWYKRAYFFLLRHHLIMDWMFALGSVFTPLLFKNLKDKQSIKPRFSLPFVGRRVFFKLNFKSFMESYPEKTKNSKEEKAKTVAIFAGCLTNYNYTKIGSSLMEILAELKINAFIPKKQECCGAPAFFTGDFKTVESLIKKNVEYFETFIDDVDAIITPEATCGAMIKEDWEKFMRDQPEWQERIKKILPKVYLATDWLYKETNLLEHLKSFDMKNEKTITYHDPCHARKVMGVFKEPRALIGANYNLVEMSNSNQCCGFGGVTMQTEKYKFSSAVGISKAKMIENTKADVVSAECSACRMQLVNAMDREKVDVEFAHPLELIAEAIKNYKYQ